MLPSLLSLLAAAGILSDTEETELDRLYAAVTGGDVLPQDPAALKAFNDRAAADASFAIGRLIMDKNAWFALLFNLLLNRGYGLITGSEAIRTHASCKTACIFRFKGPRLGISINPFFFQGLNDSQKSLILMHEILHVCFYHLSNPESYPNRRAFNAAADMIVNQEIREMMAADPQRKLAWPRGMDLFFPETYPELDLPVHAPLKYYYDRLCAYYDEQQKGPKPPPPPKQPPIGILLEGARIRTPGPGGTGSVLRPIETLQVGDPVWWWSLDNMRTFPRPIAAIQKIDDPKPVIRITTSSGRTLVCSPICPLYDPVAYESYPAITGQGRYVLVAGTGPFEPDPDQEHALRNRTGPPWEETEFSDGTLMGSGSSYEVPRPSVSVEVIETIEVLPDPTVLWRIELPGLMPGFFAEDFYVAQVRMGGGGGGNGPGEDPDDDDDGDDDDDDGEGQVPGKPGKKPGKKKGKPGKGKGKGRKPEPETLDDHDPFTDPNDSEGNPVDPNAYVPGMRDALRTNRTLHPEAYGNLPGTLKEWIDATLKPKVDWRRILRRFLGGGMSASYRHTWKRLARKSEIPPGRVKAEGPYVIVGVDTSGSIDKKLLSMFLSEVAGMAHHARILVIEIDAHIGAIYEWKPKMKVETTGGGGTVFHEMYNAIVAQHHPLDIHRRLRQRPSAIVHFTDGDAEYPTHLRGKFRIPVLWVMTKQANLERPPFGSSIFLDPES